MSTAPTDVRDVISHGRMTGRQTAAVVVAIFLNVVDGFDILVMAFTGASVSAEFGLGPGGLGLLLSAGLVGMAVGSVAIAPLADRVGRRPVTILSLSLITVLMAASAMAPSATTLGVLRFLTGLGIGAMLPNLSTFVSEFCSARWREPAVTLNSLGYALGGTIGGLIAAPLIAAYGWRAAFWLGAAFALAGLLLTLAFVPESIHYLVVRRPADALGKVNRVLGRIGRAPVEELPAERAVVRVRLVDMFRGDLGRTTVLIWVAFFCVMASFYFANSWTPQLLAGAGLSEQQGIYGGVLLSVGGVLGALVFAAIAVKVPAKLVEAGALVGGAVMFVLFSLALSQAVPALVAATLVGFFTNAAIAGMYAVVATRYPSAIRGAGVGWAVGVGRLGAILAPTLAGWLLATGMGGRGLFVVFLVPMLVAAAAVLALGRPAAATATSEKTADPKQPSPAA